VHKEIDFLGSYYSHEDFSFCLRPGGQLGPILPVAIYQKTPNSSVLGSCSLHLSTTELRVCAHNTFWATTKAIMDGAQLIQTVISAEATLHRFQVIGLYKFSDTNSPLPTSYLLVVHYAPVGSKRLPRRWVIVDFSLNLDPYIPRMHLVFRHGSREVVWSTRVTVGPPWYDEAV
jgi:hypothetical protein